MAVKAGRLRCEVPGCRRTHAPEVDPMLGAESAWICGDHTRMAGPKVRRLFRLARGRLKREAAACCDVTRRAALVNRLFDRLRNQAIERAMGL